MRNYFSSPPSSNLMVVPPPRGNGKTTSKSLQKTSTLNTFVVRSPQKPPAPQPASKPRSRARSLNANSRMIIDLDSDKDDEDFAPPSEAPSDDEASVAESAIPTDDEIDPKEEESSEPEPIFARGSSSKTAAVTKKASGAAYKHHSQPKNCTLAIKPREGDLPPISDLQLIFDDIVSRVPAVTGLFGSRGGRKLRVATMCSGTESPLLALGLFGRSFQKMGLGKLEIQHVFSCEIEPYKQA